MYQIVYNFKGEKCHFNIDTEKEAKREYKMYAAMGCNPVVYHTNTPVPPSSAPVQHLLYLLLLLDDLFWSVFTPHRSWHIHPTLSSLPFARFI